MALYLDAYRVLHVAETATTAEIHNAYHARLEEVRADMDRERVRLDLAYKVLSNPFARAELDRRRRHERSARGGAVLPQPVGWQSAASGHYVKVVGRYHLTVFRHEHGSDAGGWGYMVDGSCGERAYKTAEDAMVVADITLHWRQQGVPVW